MPKTTQKQLAYHYQCQCGHQYSEVTQIFLTFREMKAIKAKKHEKDCFSKEVKLTECEFCENSEKS